MKERYCTAAFAVFLFCIYSLLFYFIVTFQYRLDFSSFYSAALALKQGENPYQVLSAAYLPGLKELSANLNPPIVLWLITPLTGAGYPAAVVIWSLLSFISGLLGAGLAFNCAFSAQFLQKHRLKLYLAYLALFPTFCNTVIAQFGSILVFFVMLGYHFYLKKRHWLAGILWGLIIAVKFFPGLLFFYVLKERRFKVVLIMLATFLIACLIPMLVYGPAIYTQYYAMMSRILWYGDSWNASICGFIFRLFADTGDFRQNVLPIKFLCAILFGLALIWYLKQLEPGENGQMSHQPFCLTLVMMLLLSPFGWLYYFPLVILPLALTWLAAVNAKPFSIKAAMPWLFCLFLINFPMDYARSNDMSGFTWRAIFFSAHFYGLLILACLLVQQKKRPSSKDVLQPVNAHYFMPATLIIFAFGLVPPIAGLLVRLYSM